MTRVRKGKGNLSAYNARAGSARAGGRVGRPGRRRYILLHFTPAAEGEDSPIVMSLVPRHGAFFSRESDFCA